MRSSVIGDKLLQLSQNMPIHSHVLNCRYAKPIHLSTTQLQGCCGKWLLLRNHCSRSLFPFKRLTLDKAWFSISFMNDWFAHWPIAVTQPQWSQIWTFCSLTASSTNNLMESGIIKIIIQMFHQHVTVTRMSWHSNGAFNQLHQWITTGCALLRFTARPL